MGVPKCHHSPCLLRDSRLAWPHCLRHTQVQPTEPQRPPTPQSEVADPNCDYGDSPEVLLLCSPGAWPTALNILTCSAGTDSRNRFWKGYNGNVGGARAEASWPGK